MFTEHEIIDLFLRKSKIDTQMNWISARCCKIICACQEADYNVMKATAKWQLGLYGAVVLDITLDDDILVVKYRVSSNDIFTKRISIVQFLDPAAIDKINDQIPGRVTAIKKEQVMSKLEKFPKHIAL